MTREDARSIWQIIKAYGEGKTIEVYSEHYGKWIEPPEPLFNEGEKYRIKPEENYTIEQNCGENRVEGGVLSVSGSVSEKKYRPFKDFNELIETFCEKWEEETGYSWAENPVKLAVPYIWLSHKKVNAKKLITSYDYIPELEEDVVELGDMNYTMKELFELWEFLDGSPVGKLEE